MAKSNRPIDPNELTRLLGRAVRETRERVGISQSELAAKADLHPTYVSVVERGLKSPTLYTLARIAKALEKKPSELIMLAEE